MIKEEQKQKLIHGDIPVIAKVTGLSKSYVTKVLDPNDKRTNKTIEQTALKLIAMREQLANGIEKQNLHVA